MFESLQDRLDKTIQNIKGQSQLTELNIAAALKEIRRALVNADVNYKIAKEFTAKVKEEALGQNVITAVKPGDLLVKIMYDELTTLMGGQAKELDLSQKLNIILIAGLQGSGKTTFTAKLAKFLKKHNSQRPLLIAGDVYRPAAIKQLQILADGISVPVYTEEGSKNPVEIVKNGIEYAKIHGNNLVIIDTAGRLAVDAEMMNEISAIKKVANPNEILFVVDSMTGQDAVNTAKAFNDRLDFDGVILTKLDGDTRGGAALSIKYVVNKPIKFTSYGEKLEAIAVFHPDRMAERILGMGDVRTLVEKAQGEFDEKEAAKLQKKIRKNQFDFDDFKAQLKQIKRMGSVKDLLAMIPGMGKALKGVDIDDNSFKKIEAIIESMTPKERANPGLMNASRRRRIAMGSGNTLQDVNQFMKQFNEMRKMLKTMSKLSSAGRAFKGLPNQKR
ncbi:MAG: signal recognition particle protein [Chitinophagales bacterium]